jgi:HEPN domain-containing protein
MGDPFLKSILKEGKVLYGWYRNHPFYAQICFHFHQAAEKYLKAYVVANELEFRKIHDLPLLLKICSSKDSTLDRLRDACEYLNTFYVETRYPVHWPTNFSFEEAQKALKGADQIRSVIKGKIDLQEWQITGFNISYFHLPLFPW